MGSERTRLSAAAAREELDALMGRKVHLCLFVKVRNGWLEDPERYRDMGLECPG